MLGARQDVTKALLLDERMRQKSLLTSCTPCWNIQAAQFLLHNHQHSKTILTFNPLILPPYRWATTPYPSKRRAATSTSACTSKALSTASDNASSTLWTNSWPTTNARPSTPTSRARSCILCARCPGPTSPAESRGCRMVVPRSGRGV